MKGSKLMTNISNGLTFFELFLLCSFVTSQIM
jgi:hypothetical protein